MLWVLIRSASTFFYFSMKTCCGYPLEAPPSNEYPQHTFSLRNKKNINILVEESILARTIIPSDVCPAKIQISLHVCTVHWAHIEY